MATSSRRATTSDGESFSSASEPTLITLPSSDTKTDAMRDRGTTKAVGKPNGSAQPRGLALLVLAAARCGGGLGAHEGAVVPLPPPTSNAAPADAAITLARAPDDGGVASPSNLDEQAEANARWLVACAPTVPGQPPVVHVEAPGQGIPFEPIRRVLRRDASTEIAQCVTEARKGQPELNGAVLVRFVAAPDGTITGARVLVGPGNDTFDACLVDALQKPKVPKVAEGNVTLSSVPVVLCADGRTLVWPELPRRPDEASGP